jgi:acetyl-CoA C-acetyltransferase
MQQAAFIVSYSRTPIGSFGGILAGFSAPVLGGFSIKNAITKINLAPSLIEEVIMGNALPAGLGQNPSRQAALFAGLPNEVICSSVNKVCASSAKAIMFGSQNIMLGLSDIIVAGGFESMSNAPYYVERTINPMRIVDVTLIDGLKKDGLWDVYNDYHMAIAAEKAAKNLGITREMQDEFAIESYKRAEKANENNWYKGEIDPVELVDKKTGEKKLITQDEEYKRVIYEKVDRLKPAFSSDGTITAANASKVNDGGIALVLMSEKKLKELGIAPIAKIIGFADAEQAPSEFPTTPAKAIPIALKRSGYSIKDMDSVEIHEAFSCVALSNMKVLGINHSITNLNGGAVSIGHPLGVSGARTVTSLISVLKRTGGKRGVVGVCNGGGGASSIVIELVQEAKS